jgi:hypothetical protein
MAGSMEVAVVDPKGAKTVPDGGGISIENIIGVQIGDLSEKDQDEIERELKWELEEVMVERLKKKLACFQKTMSRFIKKGDTTKASVPVNSPFTLEELVHMIDVSINSKYGVDLEGITCTLTDRVWGSVESLRQEFNQECENLPRQIWATVQQVQGKVREKQGVDSPGTSTAVKDIGTGNTQGGPVNMGITCGGTVNSNP